MDINDLLQERGNLVENMKNMLDKAESEKRDLNAEELASYNKMDADQASLKERADRIASHNTLTASIENNISTVSHKMNLGDVKNAYAKEDYVNAFDAYARSGKSNLDGNFLNALQVGTNSEGGYIVPTEFETTLVEALQDVNPWRSLCNVITTGSDRNIPVEDTLGTASWTAEEASYSESDAAFGQVVLEAHKEGTIIKVSEELLADSFFDVSSYIATNFGKRFGNLEEAAYVNGDGSGKPNGMVAGSGLGVTAAGAAAITADELIDLYHSLGRMYRNNAVFVMADATVKIVRKLKDGDGRYLWQPGLQAGQPDMLLGRELVTSVGMPAATTGLKSVLFCDPSYYTIADRSNSVLQRLNELYAANGQVGFRMYKRTDGEVTLAAAFKHLIQA